MQVSNLAGNGQTQPGQQHPLECLVLPWLSIHHRRETMIRLLSVMANTLHQVRHANIVRVELNYQILLI